MTKPLLALATLLALTSFTVHADTAPAGKAAAKTAQSPKPAATTTGWITPRQKHNASGLLLRHLPVSPVKAGQRAQVALVLSGITAEDGAQVELRGSDPAMVLTLQGNPVTAPLQLSPGQMRRLDIEVLNAPEGLHYVNVFMTQRGRSNVVAVPVSVGHGRASQKPHGQVQTTPSGERIVVLPAQ
jgi:hypothetical protein